MDLRSIPKNPEGSSAIRDWFYGLIELTIVVYFIQSERRGGGGGGGAGGGAEEEKNTPPPDCGGKTLMELLELEMRARAIKALLKRQEEEEGEEQVEEHEEEEQEEEEHQIKSRQQVFIDHQLRYRSLTIAD